MSRPLISRILSKYGVAGGTISAPQSGYRNQIYRVQTANDEELCVILYKNEPHIARQVLIANELADGLAAVGFPARRTFDERLTLLKSATGTRYAGIYHYLPGQTIPWEAYTQDHIKALGKTMSDMHHLATGLHLTRRLDDVVEIQKSIVGKMQQYFLDRDVHRAMHDKLGLAVPESSLTSLATGLAAADLLGDRQALHMDFVRGNVLFREAADDDLSVAVTGVLDFEKCAYGPVIFDIARTLAFLLIDCKYKTPRQVRKYFLRSGYGKRGTNRLSLPRINQGSQDIDVLELLVDHFLLHDFYKFLRHNPYESLAKNEHFGRTRELLIERKIIELDR